MGRKFVGIVFLALALSGCGGDLPKTTSNSSNNTNPGTITYTGPTYFYAKVKPVFKQRCSNCHVEGALVSQGPQTIYDYNAMRSLLVAGTTYDNNLLKKVRAQAPFSHANGNECPSAAWQTDSPCKEIISWRGYEGSTNNPNPNPPGNTSLAIRGGINFSTANGLLSGTAADPNRLNDIVTVTFYADGAKGTGTLLGSVQANLADYDPLYPNHGFVYQLPNVYLDGRTHNIYAYGKTNAVAELLLYNTSFASVAYAKPANWNTSAAYNTIKDVCNRCHDRPAEQLYDLAAYPLKARGGTATNNDLYKTASAMNGHSGGNVCNVNNVCNNITSWWTQLFGGYP
jgi:hypothetical protein